MPKAISMLGNLALALMSLHPGARSQLYFISSTLRPIFLKLTSRSFSTLRAFPPDVDATLGSAEGKPAQPLQNVGRCYYTRIPRHAKASLCQKYLTGQFSETSKCPAVRC